MLMSRQNSDTKGLRKIGLLGLLLLLFSTMALAQIEPTITQLGTKDASINGEPECEAVNGDVYCFGMGGGDEIYLIDIDTDTWTNISDVPVPSFSGEGASCVPYGTDIYCWYKNNTSPYDEYGFKFDTITYNSTFIPGYVVAVGSFFRDCDLRPGTDEIWCFTGKPTPPALRYYDITDNNWTVVGNFGHPPNSPDGPTTDPRATCTFRNNNELWCSGGTSDDPDGFAYEEHWIYSINTNTTATKPMGIHLWEQFCRWHEDILYCYGGDDFNDVLPNMVYYDPSDDTFGNLTATVEFNSYSGACTEISATQDFCNPAYLVPAWGDATSYWLIDWQPGGLTPYTPTHGISSITGLVIDMGVELGVQFIAFVGLIAVIILAILIIRYVKTR